MKKQIAGVVTASALTLAAFTGAAHAAKDPYVVQPSVTGPTVTHTVLGNPVIVKLPTGVVGLPASGKVKWVFLSRPEGAGRGRNGKHAKTQTLKNGKLNINAHGNAFPVPGTYWIKVTSKGKTYKIKVVVK